MAVCVAVIDKDNSPLFLQCSSSSESASERDLKLHYTVHSSLDIVEEKLNVQSTGTGRSTDLRELYLGLLLTTEEYKVFGYATNTRIKFILVVALGNTVLKDQEIRSIFKRLHNVYCDAVSSPFYIPGTSLQSRAFCTTANEILSR